MKKVFIIMIFILTIVLSGCSHQEKDKENNQDNQTQIQENDTEDENVFKTEYYSVIIPEDWQDLYDWMIFSSKNNQYTLNFYEKESHAQIEGGFLFGISLYLEDEDYLHLPSYDVLGQLTVENQIFSVVVEYPTDVQFNENSANVYQQLSDDIDDILASFQAIEGYSFEKSN